jgi:hypothetical protein
MLPEAGDASPVTPAMLPLTQAPDFHTCLLPALPFLRSAHHATIMMISSRFSELHRDTNTANPTYKLDVMVLPY